MKVNVLSAEQVNFTNPQLQKIAKAMEKGAPVKIRLANSQLKGTHPVYLGSQAIKRLNKARIVGSGCMCELNQDALKKMKKDGKGLYMYGSGVHMFGARVRKPRKAPTTRKEVIEAVNTATLNEVDVVKKPDQGPTFEIKKTVKGRGMSYGANPLMQGHFSLTKN